MRDQESDKLQPLSRQQQETETDEHPGSCAREYQAETIAAQGKQSVKGQDDWGIKGESLNIAERSLQGDLEWMQQKLARDRADLLGAIMRRDAALAQKAQALQISERQRAELKGNVEARFAELTLLTRRLMTCEAELDNANERIRGLEQELQAARAQAARRLIRLPKKIRSWFRKAMKVLRGFFSGKQ